MEKDLYGKKLLIMGGSALSSEIISTAKQMGIYTIVIDWYDYDRSPGKKIADEDHLISIADTETVVNLIKKSKIDGVLTGFTDSYLCYYHEICEKAQLPCYGNQKQFEVMTDKHLFKQLCKQFNVPVVKDYIVQNEPSNDEIAQIEFPVIIKPVDSSGGRGIVVVWNEEDFSDGYQRSLGHSPGKKVIVERYMGGKEQITASYSLDNGIYKLSALYDRFMNYEQKGFASLPMFHYFPSKYISRFINEVDPYFRNLLRHLDFKNGIISIQGFVDNEGFYVYEPGFRLGGSRFYNFTERQNGTNSLKRMIRFAITGQMTGPGDSIEIDDPYFLKPCGTLFINAKPGKIARINGIDEIKEMSGVINIVRLRNVGDIVELTGSLQQTCLRVSIIADTVADLSKVISGILAKVRIISDQGEEMLMTQLEFDEYGNTNDFVGFCKHDE